MREGIFFLIFTPMKNYLLSLAALLLATFAYAQDGELRLKGLMTGSYNSAIQAAADSDFYDITLHMYPVWRNSGKHWLYVEQAVTAMQDRPYRQRMYLIEELAPDSFRSVVYTLDSAERFIGKWQDPGFFDQFDESILTEREGCAVHLKKTGPYQYAGSTIDDNCKSTLRGATYATSHVEMRSDAIESWDQGFDVGGNQVWGAEKGGYVFDRLDFEVEDEVIIEDLEELD